MSELPKFIASQGGFAGSSGFVNYHGSTKESLAQTLQEVWAQFPGAVVINGSDNWEAEPYQRPERLAHLLTEKGIHPVAKFHTGISGMSCSGIVVRGEDMAGVQACYREQYGCELDAVLKVFTQETANVD